MVNMAQRGGVPLVQRVAKGDRESVGTEGRGVFLKHMRIACIFYLLANKATFVHIVQAQLLGNETEFERRVCWGT